MPKMDKAKTIQDSSMEIRLIELIRENPELYDYGNPHYKDNNQKKIIWEYISEEMNTPVEILKKLWQKLRSKYLKKFRDLDVAKMTKSTPCDEALAFLMTSVMEYGNENICENNNSGVGDDRMLRSYSHLTAISEEERSEKTLVPEEVKEAALLPPGTEVATDEGNSVSSPLPTAASPREIQPKVASSKTSDRVLRPRHSEPARLAPRESLRTSSLDDVPSSSRRVATTPTTPSARSRNRKLIANPKDSTKVFFESMAITVASFPQYLQAIVKLQICKIVSETECDLSSPKMS